MVLIFNQTIRTFRTGPKDLRTGPKDLRTGPKDLTMRSHAVRVTNLIVDLRNKGSEGSAGLFRFSRI